MPQATEKRRVNLFICKSTYLYIHYIQDFKFLLTSIPFLTTYGMFSGVQGLNTLGMNCSPFLVQEELLKNPFLPLCLDISLLAVASRCDKR